MLSHFIATESVLAFIRHWAPGIVALATHGCFIAYIQMDITNFWCLKFHDLQQQSRRFMVTARHQCYIYEGGSWTWIYNQVCFISPCDLKHFVPTKAIIVSLRHVDLPKCVFTWGVMTILILKSFSSCDFSILSSMNHAWNTIFDNLWAFLKAVRFQTFLYQISSFWMS